MLLLSESRFNNISKKDIDLFLEEYGKELDKLSLISITQNTSSIKKITGANNFTSLATYWHPDPDSPTGYPYIRKDGIRNNESAKISDTRFLANLMRYVLISSFIYKLTKSEEHCIKSINQIRHFFLNEESRMNPDLTYSGIVIGDSDTDLKIRGAIIDTDRLTVIVDIVSILKSSSYWTKNDDDGMKAWFRQLADWFKNNPRGIRQSGYYHNIKTSYMCQLAAYLCGSGNEEEAKNYLESNVKQVLSKQITSDGQQVLEMERVPKMQYCNYNLVLLCALAKICYSLGINIWDYEDDQGCGSIRKAMIYMSSMYLNPEKWTFTKEYNNSAMTRTWLVNGVSIYDDQILHDAYNQVKAYNFNVFEHTYIPDR